MSNDTVFRTQEQEVQRLIEECVELRRTLKSISAQLSRMESRVKKAFPAAAKEIKQKSQDSSSARQISREEALAEYDRIVRIATTGANIDAERIVEQKSSEELFSLAKELGISFQKNRPSRRLMRDAVLKKIRESVLLNQHHTRT